jgi:hypothetical protein
MPPQCLVIRLRTTSSALRIWHYHEGRLQDGDVGKTVVVSLGTQTEKALEAPNIGHLAHEHHRDAYALSFDALECEFGSTITATSPPLQAFPGLV